MSATPVPHASPDPLAGVVVLEALGQGSASVVHRARRGPAEFAIKIRRRRPERPEEVVAYRREAALLAGIRHPALVRIHAVGEHDGRPALVMDLVAGETLEGRLAERGALSELAAVQVARDVAGALAAVHGSGLVHRDIKPANLLIQPDGRARLIDFGLATRIGTHQARNATIGTVRYSPPEQTGLLARPIDGRSDLYALGVVLFEMVTGAPPFVGPDAGELIRLHASVIPPSVRVAAPHVSSELARIVARLLAKDPDDRYQHAGALLADLAVFDRPGAHTDRSGAPEEAPRPVTSRAAMRRSDELPLVARERELTTLLRCWHRAERGHGTAALVEGAPGSGKRRLLRELAFAATSSGAAHLSARASSTSAAPMAALREAIDGYLAQQLARSGSEGAPAIEHIRSALAAAGDAAALLSPDLAALQDGDDEPPEVGDDQFVSAIAAFLLALARAHGGLLLELVDAPCLDPTTRAVLSELAADLDDAPLLIVATSRDDPGSVAARAGFVSALGTSLAETITLGALRERETGELIGAMLGDTRPDDVLVEQLHHRAAGNPFAIGEYVRAITDAGLVRPSWGTMLVDRTGLDQLTLPDDVIELVLSRIQRLSDDTRHLLGFAAITGNSFAPTIVARAAALDAASAAHAWAEAQAERLIEPRGPGKVGFVHERVRETLIGAMSDEHAERCHTALVQAYEARHAPECAPAAVCFAVVRHLEATTVGVTARQRMQWNRRAGHLALQQHAAAQAVTCFSAAAQAADQLGVATDPALHEEWAAALLRTGDVRGADEQTDRILAVSADPLQRARLLLQRSQTRFSTYDQVGAGRAATAGLEALGCPLPRTALGRVTAVVAALARILLLVLLGRRRGHVTEVQRAHLALEVDLLRAAAQVSFLRMRQLEIAALTLLAVPPAMRLGPSRQLVQVLSAAAVVASTLGAERGRRRLIGAALQTAHDIHDPSAVAYASMYRFLSLEAAGHTREAGAAAEGLLDEHGRWLETADLLVAVGSVAYNLDLRGYVREALAEWRSVHDRVLHASASGTHENPYLLMGWITLETLGERAEAATLRQQVQRIGRPDPANRYRRQMYLGALIRYLRDQNEYREELRDAIVQSDALRINPRTANAWLQSNFMQPYAAAVEFAERTEDDETRRRLLTEASRRWRTVRAARCVPVVEAYNQAARASHHRLEGRPRRAARALRRAEALAVRCDHPRAHCEIARIRALLARDAGEHAEFRRQAQIALRLAADGGWHGVLSNLEREFGERDGTSLGASSGSAGSPISRAGTVHATSATTHHTHGGSGTSLRDQRTLAALLKLSVAASHIREVDELARLSLDHVVALLGAERGFLFLAEPGTGELKLAAVRDASGGSVDCAHAKWSRTVIREAAETRAPVLLTGSEEALAIGAESAVQHDLRSILACPLMLEGRLLGVLKVDSRLARGIFDAGDSQILSAIGQQIAVALETTRAAQLERTVASEREQRGLAEALRDAMADIAATLDPTEVFTRMLAHAERLIGCDRAVVLLQDGHDRWKAGAARGTIDPAALSAALERRDDPLLAAAARGTEPAVCAAGVAVHGPLLAALGHPGSLLRVPLVVRGEQLGVLLLGSGDGAALGGSQLDLAATFAAQALIAHENARLFTEVERMATTDELTQVNNRRHFFELGNTQFLTAQRYELPLATLMLDIDHFKRVNDTFGHAAGDDVIREVARRLRGLIRTVDIVGRYGGEEFAFLLPYTGDDAVILAERLREAVEHTPIVTGAGEISLTASIGVAVYRPDDRHLAALLGRADQALYAAKASGRNCVRVDAGSAQAQAQAA